VNRRLVFQDPSCYSGNLDHTVLVVGYDISSLFPYWVIRNSWGASWCAGGYMRLGIQGGTGVCGMNVLPAYYPVAAPPAGDPCYTTSSIPDGDTAPALNPCGGGVCKGAPLWGSYSYTCSCPRGFAAVNNTVRVNPAWSRAGHHPDLRSGGCMRPRAHQSLLRWDLRERREGQLQLPLPHWLLQ